MTRGAFDPTVDLAAIGYDRDFASVAVAHTIAGAARPAPGCGGVEQTGGGRVLRLAAGTALDLGGIGKGLAADLVAEEMRTAGAAGVSVNVGGDVRVVGAPPDPAGWVVGIDLDPDPDSGVTLTVALAGGAVATSSRLRRRWSSDAGEQHHLVDPATGRPARSGWASVSVVAGQAWWAEVLAKVVFLAGPSTVELPSGATGVALTDGGGVRTFPGFEEFRR